MTTDQPASGQATPAEPEVREGPPPGIRGAGAPPPGPRGSRGPDAFSGTISGAGRPPAGPCGSRSSGEPGRPAGGVSPSSRSAGAAPTDLSAAESNGGTMATVGRFLSEVERARAGLGDDD